MSIESVMPGCLGGLKSPFEIRPKLISWQSLPFGTRKATPFLFLLPCCLSRSWRQSLSPINTLFSGKIQQKKICTVLSSPRLGAHPPPNPSEVPLPAPKTWVHCPDQGLQETQYYTDYGNSWRKWCHSKNLLPYSCQNSPYDFIMKNSKKKEDKAKIIAKYVVKVCYSQ